MCCGKCKCSEDNVKAPESDTPKTVRKYWAYASLLNGCGKMINSLGGHMRSNDMDESTITLITRAISALNAVEARVTNELKKQREEAVNAKG